MRELSKWPVVAGAVAVTVLVLCGCAVRDFDAEHRQLVDEHEARYDQVRTVLKSAAESLPATAPGKSACTGDVPHDLRPLVDEDSNLTGNTEIVTVEQAMDPEANIEMASPETHTPFVISDGRLIEALRRSGPMATPEGVLPGEDTSTPTRYNIEETFDAAEKVTHVVIVRVTDYLPPNLSPQSDAAAVWAAASADAFLVDVIDGGVLCSARVRVEQRDSRISWVEPGGSAKAIIYWDLVDDLQAAAQEEFDTARRQ